MKNKEKYFSIVMFSKIFVIFLLIAILPAAPATAENTSTAENSLTSESTSLSGPYAYITNSIANTVSVIDTSTGIVKATVNVWYEPFGVAVNPTGTKVYITNLRTNNVYVINASTNTITAAIKVGNYPRGVA